MARTVLRGSDGKCVTCNEGETSRIKATFYDYDGDAFVKASLTSVRVTVFDELSGEIIAGIEDIDVKDANDGTVSDAGLFQWFIPPEANRNVGSPQGDEESHIVLVEWNWNDGQRLRYGAHEFVVTVLCNKVASGVGDALYA